MLNHQQSAEEHPPIRTILLDETLEIAGRTATTETEVDNDTQVRVAGLEIDEVVREKEMVEDPRINVAPAVTTTRLDHEVPPLQDDDRIPTAPHVLPQEIARAIASQN